MVKFATETEGGTSMIFPSDWHPLSTYPMATNKLLCLEALFPTEGWQRKWIGKAKTASSPQEAVDLKMQGTPWFVLKSNMEANQYM